MSLACALLPEWVAPCFSALGEVPMKNSGSVLSIGLFALAASDASAVPLLSPGDLALAVDLDVVFASSYPPDEAVG